MFSVLVLIFFYLGIQVQSQLIPLNNHVVGEPVIECHSSTVSVNFKTSGPFKGHVYVKGHRKIQQCHKDYATNRDNGGFLHIPFDACGMRRNRMAKPKGMAISATVMISFHKAFVTAVDRAYKVKCYYMEEDIGVSHGITVSMLPTTDLGLTPPMPTCRYRVLSGGPLGQPLTFARVGDQVYHKWVCDYEMPDMYCMVVHSCTVDDGEDSIFQVLDKDGCAKDPVIMEDLEYLGDLSAGTDASVFKFADKPHVYFACQIALTMKHEHGGRCPRPTCGAAQFNRIKRVKRSALHLDHDEDDYDLEAQPLVVLDIDDANDSIDTFNTGITAVPAKEGICVSGTVFGVVLAAVLLSTLTAIVLVTTVVLRGKQPPSLKF